MGTEKLEESLDPCEIISTILSRSSIDEAYVFKPGNASVLQDIDTVRFKDIIESALILKSAYYKACKRGINYHKPFFDLLYNAIITSLRNNIRFSLFGTSMLLLPISYISGRSKDFNDFLVHLKGVSTYLDEVEGEWFIRALKLLSPSYLGKLEGEMDYERISKVKLNEILLYSSMSDEVSRNIILGYPYSLKVYQIIKENRCGSFERDVQKAFIELLREVPDGLIYRKHGARSALEVSKFARSISNCPDVSELREFNDFLLKNKFNPGSTADIVASGIALFYIEKYYYRT